MGRSRALVKHQDVILARRLALGTFPRVEDEVVLLEEDVVGVALVARRVGRLLSSQDVVLKVTQSQRPGPERTPSSGLLTMSKGSAGRLVGFTAGTRFSGCSRLLLLRKLSLCRASVM